MSRKLSALVNGDVGDDGDDGEDGDDEDTRRVSGMSLVHPPTAH